MNIIQCKMCKKPFHSIGGKICPNCLDKMEDDYVKVRDYIREHDRADIDKVSEETEVSKSVILHFLKEGRLELGGPDGGGAGGMLVCEVCKKPINTGRMCRDCKRNIATKMQKSLGINEAPQKKEKSIYSTKDSAKMHIEH